jgi:hypothetical protein
MHRYHELDNPQIGGQMPTRLTDMINDEGSNMIA